MHYLYVGYYVDDQSFCKLLEEKIHNMSPARQKFEYNIIRGLSELLGDDIDFISYVPTDGKIELPKFTQLGNVYIKHIEINTKSGTSMVKAVHTFSSFLKNLGDDKLHGLTVIMYAVNPVLLQAVLRIKKKYSIRLITICSEAPSLRRYGSSFKAELKKGILTHYNEKFDGYVLFSEKMKDVISLENKPFIVLEGIAPELSGLPQRGKENVVMYAGGLASDNNIRMLIEACSKIDIIDELWICGVGEDQNYVEQVALHNPKVKYFGMVNNNKVVSMENKAKLLVNLRNPQEELTKYSFPSKILEYIASGSMVMSTKLGGIPDDYYKYILHIEGINSEEIREKIIYALTLPDNEYVEKCIDAQTYICETKNYITQTKKILELSKSVR